MKKVSRGKFYEQEEVLRAFPLDLVQTFKSGSKTGSGATQEELVVTV